MIAGSIRNGINRRFWYRCWSNSSLVSLSRNQLSSTRKGREQYNRNPKKKPELLDFSDKTAWIPPDRSLPGSKGNYYEEEDGVEFMDKMKDEELADDSNPPFDFINLSDGKYSNRSMQNNDQDIATLKDVTEVEVFNDEEWKSITDDLFRKDGDLNTHKINEELGKSEVPDWSMTRRRNLEGSLKDPYAPKLPQKIRHTLFSSKEIVSCLTSMGGKNVVLIKPIPDLEFDGMIIVTGTSMSHNRHLANILYKCLRERELQDCNVHGAMVGPEGGATKQDDEWIGLDCGNYTVQFMDEMTRKLINLEELWDPNKRQKLRLSSEKEIDEYIDQNTVPELLYSKKTLPNMEDIFENIRKTAEKNKKRRS